MDRSEDRDMPENDNYNRSKDDLQSWIPTIIMLICFAPVGVIMLLVKLFGQSGSAQSREQSGGQHPYDVRRQAQEAAQEARRQGQRIADEARRQGQQAAQEARSQGQRAAQEAKEQARQVVHEARQAAQETRRQAQEAWRQAPKQSQAAPKGGFRPKKKSKQELLMLKWASKGKGLIVAGSIIACLFGIAALDEMATMLGASIPLLQYGLENIFLPLGFCGGGLVMLYHGLTQRGKYRRYRKYLALIGKRDSISVSSLAQAMGVSINRACGDLQDMLDDGLFPTGFLDLGSGRLFLSDEGLQEEPAPAAEAPEDAPRGMELEDAVLMEIRQLNDAIADETMSQKIDRIGEITGKIFAYLRDKPDKENQLRSFLSYYLPTTLKILGAYAQMESQGIEGENITAAKVRIEGMMDKVVDGFESQLDRLFQDDAMDITTDVAVLERMLDKDGLGGGQGFQLGG